MGKHARMRAAQRRYRTAVVGCKTTRAQHTCAHVGWPRETPAHFATNVACHFLKHAHTKKNNCVPAHASAFHHQRMCQFSWCCIPKSAPTCMADWRVWRGHPHTERWACVRHIYFSVLWIRARFYDAHVVWQRRQCLHHGRSVCVCVCARDDTTVLRIMAYTLEVRARIHTFLRASLALHALVGGTDGEWVAMVGWCGGQRIEATDGRTLRLLRVSHSVVAKI